MESRPSILLITDGLIDAVVADARQSARRRKNHNFHLSDKDNPHRFLNAFLEGSYVRPHRHVTPPKAEAFLVLIGHAVIFVFDDGGRVASAHILGPHPYTGRVPSRVADATAARGVDLLPGVWHSVAALTPVAVCYEVKPGPWEPATDKDFAPWAPAEGAPGASEYLSDLLA